MPAARQRPERWQPGSPPPPPLRRPRPQSGKATPTQRRTNQRPRPRWDPATYEPLPENKALDAARNAGEWVAIIGVAVAVAFIVKIFLLQAFYIPSESMEPTLQKGDRVLVNKLAYKTGNLKRGDVVVFESPPGLDDPSVTDLIKRVQGVPGDTIEFRNDSLFVNGTIVDEPYLRPGTVTNDPFGVLQFPYKVPPGQVFVMGDNRTNSTDGRYFGAFNQNLIVGKAFIQVWPPLSIDIL